MTNFDANSASYWKETWRGWSALLLASALMVFAFRGSYDYLTYMWFNKEEYSHAVMIPFITAFLVWQKKDVLQQMSFSPNWYGVVLVVFGALMLALGELSALVIMEHYGFLLAVLGLALAYMGWQAFRVILVPLLMLAFMIPLPGFLYQGLSNELQLISSEIGVWFIRLFDISVYLEGNVIDLGAYKLQVVEACNGLRYLFPFVTLGFIAAYFFQGAMWKRVVIFLSSIPITILMNSFRIGIIGVTVEYWGQGMAEGFLHDFEGWAVFMSCMAILILEMWILAKIGNDKRSLVEVFGLNFPEPAPEGAEFKSRPASAALWGGVFVLLMVAISTVVLPERGEKIPDRAQFSTFPADLGDWKGINNPLEQIYADALRFDDYIQVNYVNENIGRVNLFASYYSSQIEGNMPHSPRACLPGGGWNITDLRPEVIDGVLPDGGAVSVNRVVVRNGEYKQLVYYWFQQRGRIIDSEFEVKWYIFWDSLTRHRSDGALVRLMTAIPPGTTLEEGDKRLSEFAREIIPAFGSYIPE